MKGQSRKQKMDHLESVQWAILRHYKSEIYFHLQNKTPLRQENVNLLFCLGGVSFRSLNDIFDLKCLRVAH